MRTFNLNVSMHFSSHVCKFYEFIDLNELQKYKCVSFIVEMCGSFLFRSMMNAGDDGDGDGEVMIVMVMVMMVVSDDCFAIQSHLSVTNGNRTIRISFP